MGRNLNGIPATAYSRQRRKPFRLRHVKSKFASIRFAKSKIERLIIRNSDYLNRILAIFCIEICVFVVVVVVVAEVTKFLVPRTLIQERL